MRSGRAELATAGIDRNRAPDCSGGDVYPVDRDDDAGDRGNGDRDAAKHLVERVDLLLRVLFLLGFSRAFCLDRGVGELGPRGRGTPLFLMAERERDERSTGVIDV